VTTQPSPPARFGARAVVAGLALTVVAVPFALLLFLVQDQWRPLLRVDRGARDDLHAFAVDHGGFVTVMKGLSTAGGTSTWFVVFALVAAWLVWRRRPRMAVFVVVTAAGSMLLNALVKRAVDRARPVLEDPVAHAGGLSFPSGHAQAAMVGYGTLLLVAWPYLGSAARIAAAALAALMIVAIGFSRVALGVHYVSDVLAGYVLGAAWLALMAAAFDAWRREEAAAT
jgi:uncharacterized protein (TIGR03382 family)